MTPASSSTSGSVSMPQRTITRGALARTRRRPARRASPRGRSSGRARSRATARAPRPARSPRVPAARSASIAEREMNVTPKPPTTALRADSWSPSSSGTSRSRRRTPAARSSSSITCRTPAPSCISTSGSPCSSASDTLRFAKRWPRGTASTTSSRKNGSKTTPRCRRCAPTTPSSSSRRATCSTTRCVSETDSATCTPGWRRWNSHEHDRQHRPARPRRRADLEPARQLAFCLVAELRERAAPRARAAAARCGRGAARPRSARRGARSGRAAGARAASRASGSAGSPPAA